MTEQQAYIMYLIFKLEEKGGELWLHRQALGALIRFATRAAEGVYGDNPRLLEDAQTAAEAGLWAWEAA